MNCDQVFDILTRGPFPTGTDCDEPVESHLSACPDCRRLAEALRPALELFQEAVDPEESRGLPGYWSALATDRTQAVMPQASEVEPRPLRPRHPNGRLSGLTKFWTPVTAWRMAAMLALGVSLGLLASSRGGAERADGLRLGPDGSVPTLAPVDDYPRLNLADRMQWTSLPGACLPGRADASHDKQHGEQLLARVEFQCCSGCHNAGSDAVPTSATAGVAQSCQVCHHEPAAMRVPAP